MFFIRFLIRCLRVSARRFLPIEQLIDKAVACFLLSSVQDPGRKGVCALQP